MSLYTPSSLHLSLSFSVILFLFLSHSWSYLPLFPSTSEKNTPRHSLHSHLIYMLFSLWSSAPAFVNHTCLSTASLVKPPPLACTLPCTPVMHSHVPLLHVRGDWRSRSSNKPSHTHVLPLSWGTTTFTISQNFLLRHRPSILTKSALTHLQALTIRPYLSPTTPSSKMPPPTSPFFY